MDLQKQLTGLLADGFQITDLEDAAKIAAAAALEQLPGSSLTERIDWAKSELLSAVETVDNLVPVLGAWAEPRWSMRSSVGVWISCARNYCVRCCRGRMW